MPNKTLKSMSRLACWWRADQIRVSPSQGRLMRIRPPSLLEIEGARLIVRSRHQDNINGQSMLRYICKDGAETSELWVFPPDGENWRSRVLWIRGRERRVLEESLVTVYPLD